MSPKGRTAGSSDDSKDEFWVVVWCGNGKSICFYFMLRRSLFSNVVSFKWNSIFLCPCWALQNRLKSSQRDKVRQFISFTETNEKTAINCLSQNDWRLEVASDSYFQNPERYFIDTKPLVDKKRISHLFDRYKGRHDHYFILLSSSYFCLFAKNYQKCLGGFKTLKPCRGYFCRYILLNILA